MENLNTVEYKGTFRLVNKVAEGGMATVYEAEQLGPEGFTKRIALKVIHPHYAKRAEFLRLFIDEAKLSANLMHGNVVQIYQLGVVGGEYLDRKSTRLNSSHGYISYAVFCLKKKTTIY